MSQNDQGYYNFKKIIMLKKISNLGDSLEKKEQKEITGGRFASIDDGASFPCNCDDGTSTTVSTIQECIDFCC